MQGEPRLVALSSSLPTCRLLIVSDHAGSSDALAAHLARHGFAVVGEVRSAASAAVAARTCDPDLVIVDGALHGGWRAVAEALDGLIPRGRIVVLTAYLGPDELRETRAAGIGATLLKHVEGGSLASRLRAMGTGH
jgi:DNA-binding NarL/FixJ family response regulator